MPDEIEKEWEEVEKEPETVSGELEPVVEAPAQTTGRLSDDDVNRIAERVYDKVKAFTTDLATAAENVEELVSESVAAKAEEITPPEEAVAEAAPEDVKPERSHRLFYKPMRKRE